MIIDAHCHLVDLDWLPMKWWQGLAKVAVPVLEKMGMTGVTVEMVIGEVMPNLYFDPTGEKQIQAMDEAGIDKAVIFGVDYGLALGEAALSIEEINKKFAGLQEKYPDRLIALATIDPRRPQARDMVGQALDEWGLKGLKLHSGAGFYPNSKEAYALFESLADRRVPVVCHTGHILQPLYSKYCHPLWLDEVCVDFPEINFVAAHMGHGFMDQVFHMGACKTNLLTDISDWQRRAVHETELFARALRSALDNFGPDRVMFGTDAPYLRPVLSDKDYLNLVKSLPENAPAGIKFSAEEIEAVLGGSAARLYGLA